MRRFRAVAGEVAIPALGSLIGLALYSFLTNAATEVPALDRAMRPVIAFGYFDPKTNRWEAPIQNVTREEDRVCWDIYIEKLNPATVRGYEFMASGGDLSATIPTSSYQVNEDGSRKLDQVLETHAVGDRWHRRYCFDIAYRIPTFRAITISGFAHHERWPHLWTVDTPTPKFTVGPMKSP